MSGRRLPIKVVGEVLTGPGGEIAANNWKFAGDWLPDGTEVGLVDGTLGGWTGFELHTIAHGAPCDCPIGKAQEGHSWPP